MFKQLTALALIAACIALAAGVAFAEGETPKFGRHEVWSRAREAAAAATQAGELDAARRELVAAFGEAVRFAEGDPRLEQTQRSLDALTRELSARGDPKPIDELLAQIGALADAAGGPAAAIAIDVTLRRSALAGEREDDAAAEAFARAALARAEERFGPAHDLTLRARGSLIGAIEEQDPARAIPLAEEYAQILRDALGPDSDRVVSVESQIAMMHLASGWPERGRPFAARALEEAVARGEAGARAGALWALAIHDLELGDFASAERNAGDARPLFELSPRGEGLDSIDAIRARARMAQGDLQGAYDVVGAALARVEADAGAKSARLISLLMLDAAIYESEEKPADAERVLRRALAIAEASGELGAGSRRSVRWQLAELLSERGSVAESEALQAEVRRDPSASFATRQRRCAADNALAYAYTWVKRWREALPLAQRAVACTGALVGADNPGLASALDTLGWAQFGAGQADAASRTFDDALTRLEARRESVFARRVIWRHYAAVQRKRGDADRGARAERALAELAGEIRVAVDRSRAPALAGAANDHPEENYRYVPPAGWRRWTASAQAGAPDVAFVSEDPQGLFTISVEAIDERAVVALDQVADAIVKATKERAGEVEILRREQHAVGGLDGIRLVTHAKHEGDERTFVLWISAQAGFLYQLTYATPNAPKNSRQALEQATSAFSGFSLIDPQRAPTSALRELTSERFGYHVKLHGEAWRKWEDLAEELPHAERGALFGNESALAVVPVTLAGIDLDLATVASGLDNMLSPADFSSGTSVRVDGSEGREIEFSRNAGNRRFWYRMRAFQRGGAGFLVAVWTRSRDADERARFFEAIEGFSLLDEPEPPALDALSEAERARQALFFNDAGISALERGRPDTAILLLEQAVRLMGDGPMPLRNLAYAMLDANRPRDLLARLADHETRVLGDAQLRSYRARAREQVGDTDGAISDYGAAIAGGADDAQLDQHYVELLLAAGRGAEARTHIDARAEKSGSVALRRVRASVLRETGDAKEAARELEALRKLRPADNEILFELARTQSALNDYAGVVATCDAILKAGPSSFALYLKAHAQAELADYAGAKTSVEAALAIEPDSEEAKTFLAHLSAILGEGENTAIKQPLEPVALPAELRAWMEAAAKTTPEDEYETRDLWRVKGVQYTRGRELRTTLWLKVDVRDQRSIERLSRLEFDFHPLWEKVYVNSLVVRDAKGKELSHGRASDAYVLDPLQDEQATSKRRLYVPVRGLAVGTTLELVLTRLEAGEPERFTYLDDALSIGVPIERSALFVSGDIGELVWRASPGVIEAKRDGRVDWRVLRPLVDRWEPLQPKHKSYLPAVRIADKRDSWPALVREYLKDLRVFEQPDAALAKLAREQTRGLETPDEKARALAGFVQRTLSYQAIEFGRRARIPNAAGDVLEKKFGDCKDHAVLLHQLLMGAGVRSRLALASFGSEIEPNLPSIDQFDHMIVRCLDCREARWLDATDKSLHIGSEAPRGLTGNAILLLEDEDPRLETIPAPEPAPHLVSSERTVKLGSDGSLSVDEHIAFSGYPAAWVRDFLRSSDRATWKEVMRNVLLAEHDIVRSVEVDNLDRASERLELRLAYDVRGAFSRAGTGWVGRAPIAWEEQLLNLAQVEKRQSPVEFDTPFRFDSRLRLEPPDGFSLRASPLGAAERGGAFTRLRGDLSPDGRALVMHYEISRSAVSGPAGRYAELDRESSAVFDYLRQSFELVRASD